MALTLSTAQHNQLVFAAGLMTKETAVELPLHESVIQELAAVAASTGYLTQGAFYEAIKLNPVSTLVSFIAFVGAP
jgi:hypothetical protein